MSLQLQFLDDAGTWNDVRAHTNTHLLGLIGNGLTHGDDGMYVYDLVLMQQLNPRTGMKRRLRTFAALSVSDPRWYFTDDLLGNVESESLTRTIVARSRAGLPVDRFRLHAAWASYDVHVYCDPTVHGIQINRQTGRTRPIGPVAATPAQGSEGQDGDSSDDDDDAPDELRCPITHRLMTDPVMTTDGKVYERAAILRWFQRKLSSPLTGLPLPSGVLVTHDATARAVRDYRAGRHGV